MSEPAAKEKFSVIEMLGKHPGTAAIIGGTAVLSVWGVYLWQFRFGLSDSQETWGQFGDFVGGTLNSVFGLLGFLILLSSLRLQAKELEETRKELRATSEAQKMQAEHFEREAKITNHSEAIKYIMTSDDFNIINISVSRIVKIGERRIINIYSLARNNLIDFSEIDDDFTSPSLKEAKIQIERILFIDYHCSGLFSISPRSPILISPIKNYEVIAKKLEEKGWATFKFFGKHDFPLR